MLAVRSSWSFLEFSTVTSAAILVLVVLAIIALFIFIVGRGRW